MNAKQAIQFDTVEEQIRSLYDEIGKLSQKKPNEPLNKFKLKFINELLTKINSLLGKRYLPFSEFTVFSDDELPSNSDVVFILSQYLQKIEIFMMAMLH